MHLNVVENEKKYMYHLQILKKQTIEACIILSLNGVHCVARSVSNLYTWSILVGDNEFYFNPFFCWPYDLNKTSFAKELWLY